jgi:hypothetical protein
MAGLNDWIKVNSSFCSFDFSNLNIKTKKESIDYTVETILDNGENFYLALSGGLDSEFAAKCLHEREVDFIPIIFDIGTNRVENWYAHRWCYVNGKKPLVIEMSEPQIVELFPKIAKKKKTTFYSVINLVLSEIVYEKGGCLILGGEEVVDREYFLENSFRKMSDNLETHEFAFCVENDNRGHIGGFLSYTPELFYNCLSELDYEKPGQLSLAEYYNVLDRPKINSFYNLVSSPKLLEINHIVNQKNPIIKFRMGNKNDFLEIARNRGIIKVSATPIF